MDKIGSSFETRMLEDQNDERFPIKEYLKLLKYLKNQKMRIRNNNNHNNDESSPNNTQDDDKQLLKRGFFLFPNRRSSQRHRPIYFYGRKSHWDTFFG